MGNESPCDPGTCPDHVYILKSIESLVPVVSDLKDSIQRLKGMWMALTGVTTVLAILLAVLRIIEQLN